MKPAAGLGAVTTEPGIGHLRRCLDALREEHSVPGLQLAVLVDGRATTVASGLAEAGGSRPVGPESRFPIASVTKVFTATLALHLVAAGRLALDAPIATYLPALRAADPRRAGITVERLLLHTSDLPNVHLVEHLAVDTLEAYLRVLRDAPFDEAATGLFSYCEIGYALLGHLAELACATSWYGALRARVLARLGARALLLPAERGSPGLVTGHTVHPATGEVTPTAITLPRLDIPTGGLAMAAGDLVRLASAFAPDPGPDPLLPAELVRLALHERRVEVPEKMLADEWCLAGARYRARDGRWWFGHDGNMSGFHAHFRFDPRSGQALALLSNSTSGQQLWPRLLDRLRDATGVEVGDPGFLPLSAEAPDEPVDPGALGTYRGGLMTFVVTESDRGLTIEVTRADAEREAYALRPAGGGRYLGRGGGMDVPVTFVADARGGDRYLFFGGKAARRL